MKKIRTALTVFKSSGLSGLIAVVLNKNLRKIGYVQYPLSYSPLKINGIANFLARLNVTSNDLVVVPDLYKKKFKTLFRVE